MVSKELTGADSLLLRGSTGLTFQYSPLLFTNIKESQVEGHLGGMRPFPAYTAYEIQGYPFSDIVSGAPRIYRFSASAYIKVNPAISYMLETIKGLKSGQLPAEAAKGAKYGLPMPPVVFGEQQYFLNFHQITFKGGSGYTFLTQFMDTQRGKIGGMTEIFVGLGGKDTLIVAVFPLRTNLGIVFPRLNRR